MANTEANAIAEAYAVRVIFVPGKGVWKYTFRAGLHNISADRSA
jgi:hypothetical protein